MSCLDTEMAAKPPSVDLSVCPCCDSGLVQPTTWREVGEQHWHLTLRCPNCEWLGDGVWDHAAVVAYDAKLCAATDDILFILEAAAREAGWSDF